MLPLLVGVSELKLSITDSERVGGRAKAWAGARANCADGATAGNSSSGEPGLMRVPGLMVPGAGGGTGMTWAGI